MTSLNVLLSHALVDLTRSCERAGAEEVVVWSNLLRAVDDDGCSRKELPSRVRLSKRAVRTMLNCLARHEWANVDGDRVTLTDRGRRARDTWRSAIAEAEATWPGAASIRGPLEALVSRLPLEHPHYPCGYGTADERITGGPGVDWKPVARGADTDTVSSTSLLALLSQALVGFAVEYESRVPFAIHVGVHLDAAFTSDSIALSDAPRALMIAGNGKSSLERHGAVAVSAAKEVTLTELGRSVRDAYGPTVEEVESSMPSARPLRDALEGLGLQHAGHADHPEVRHVGGAVGFAEVSAEHRRA